MASNQQQMMAQKISSGSNITADLWQTFESATLTGANLLSTDHNGTGSWSVTQGTLSTVSTNATGQKATISTVNGSASTGSFGLLLAKADGTNAYVHYNFAAGHASMSFGAWFFIPTLSVDGNQNDIIFIYNVTTITAGRDTGVIYIAFPGSLTNGVAVTGGNWYWVTALFVNGGTCKMKVFDSSGTLVGVEKTTTGNAGNVAEMFLFNDSGSHNFTANFYCDNVVLDWTSSVYPLGP